jgi:type I restriction enzyme S subunit
MKSNYKPIGDYIQTVNNRNTDLKVVRLLGLSMDKEFRETTSNIVGTDMSVYKIMYKYQFACDFMSPIRVNKLPVVLKLDDEPNLVSPAYPVFEIKDRNKLDPEYLMMWFRRSEFDRYTTFKCDSAIRGGYDWQELCETPIPVPPITTQRQIVSEYNAVQNRINQNKALIEKLEQTAQAIYKEWFVDKVDRENLPKGWRLSKIGDEVETIGGGTPSTEEEEYWKDGNILWYSPTDITNGNSLFTSNSQSKITKIGLQKSSAKLCPAYSLMMTSRATIGKVAINTVEATTNQGFITLIPTKELKVYFLYDWLKTQLEEINNLASGSTFLEISKTDFRSLIIVIPDKITLKKYDETILPCFELIKLKSQESQKLEQLKTLLLSRLTINNYARYESFNQIL